MSKISDNDINARNIAFRHSTDSAERLVGVFIGATNSIGKETCSAFAKYVQRPTIIIVGRNGEAGNTIVDICKKLNEQCIVEFIACDITELKNVVNLAKELKSKCTKINFLNFTSGFVSAGGRNETLEGLDKKLSASYFSRWKLVDELISELEQGARDGGARVVSCLTGGMEGKYDIDDIGLKNDYGPWKAMDVQSAYNSLAALRFGRTYPSISFSHVYPGMVRTTIMQSLPTFWRILGDTALFFGSKPQVSGKRFFHLGVVDERYKASGRGYILGSNLQQLKPGNDKVLDEKEKIWYGTRL